MITVRESRILNFDRKQFSTIEKQFSTRKQAIAYIRSLGASCNYVKRLNQQYTIYCK